MYYYRLSLHAIIVSYLTSDFSQVIALYLCFALLAYSALAALLQHISTTIAEDMNIIERREKAKGIKQYIVAF